MKSDDSNPDILRISLQSDQNAAKVSKDPKLPIRHTANIRQLIFTNRDYNFGYDNKDNS